MATINSQRAPSGTGTFVLGVVGLAVFATLIVLWIKATAPHFDTAEAERAAGRVKKREELANEAAAKLHAVAWVDKEKGVVQLPIDDAMRLVALELKDKKVAKSGAKVPATLPMPVADPKSAEPPPMALTSAPQGAELIHFSAGPNAPAATEPPAPAAPQASAPAGPASAPAPGVPAPAPGASAPAPGASAPAPEASAPAPGTPAPAPGTPAPAPGAPAPAPGASAPAPGASAPAPGASAPAPGAAAPAPGAAAPAPGVAAPAPASPANPAPVPAPPALAKSASPRPALINWPDSK